MKAAWLACLAALCAGMTCGCASSRLGEAPSGAFAVEALSDVGGEAAKVRTDRMMVWKAHLEIEVWNVSNAVAQACSTWKPGMRRPRQLATKGAFQNFQCHGTVEPMIRYSSSLFGTLLIPRIRPIASPANWPSRAR